MSVQTLTYMQEMARMYEVISKRCVDNYILTSNDILFLQIYKRTIDKNAELPQQHREMI